MAAVLRADRNKTPADRRGAVAALRELGGIERDGSGRGGKPVDFKRSAPTREEPQVRGIRFGGAGAARCDGVDTCGSDEFLDRRKRVAFDATGCRLIGSAPFGRAVSCAVRAPSTRHDGAGGRRSVA